MRLLRRRGSVAESAPSDAAATIGDGQDPAVPPAFHPERVDGDPHVLRWVLAPGTLPVRGTVTTAPGALGELLDRGDLTEVVVSAEAVLTRLGPDRTWAHHGPIVRSALADALAHPDAWSAAGDEVIGREAVLAEAARAAIDGEAGDYVRSHGGQIELVGVHGCCVDVRLSGACGHCPAAAATLRHRVESAIRAGCPEAEVRQVS